MRSYFTFRTNNSVLVNKFLDENLDEFTFDGLPNYPSEIKKGDIVFIVLGGDKPVWDLGLRGICTISEEPFDLGYDTKKPKYFKVKLKKEIIFDRSISREELVPYRGVLGMIFIGAMIKGEPNQADVRAPIEQVYSLVDALRVELPNKITELEKLFDLDEIRSEIISKEEKEKFINWMEETKNLSKKSISNYISGIDSITKWGMQEGIIDRKLYSILNIKSYSDKLKELEVFKENDIRGNNMYSASINRFIEYREDKIKKINLINKYINNEGFNYSKDSLKNFYLSLKSKPFVILAGISGTGKSKLVKLFAEAIGAKYNLISVKPDWNDSTDLLGYRDLNDKFVKGELTKIILEASKDENKDKPYFVCLDEMNLARVEYYFSEYLSLIESRERKDDGLIVTDKIFDSEDAEYKDLVFPENLYIVGTVNMDDTTFGFSKKVLDRANTIEFSDVDLTLDFLNNNGEANEILGVDNSFLKTSFISLKELIHSNEIGNKFIEDINNRIIEINNILKKYSRHFAYRVRDEILIYMAENKISNLFLEENSELTEEENEEISISKAFDYQIMQKILPLISGSDEYTRDILIDLFNYAFDKKDRKEYIIDETNYRFNIEDVNLEEAKYKRTAKKLKDMLRGYDNGYATYWQ